MKYQIKLQISLLRKAIINIRDFFWPVLELEVESATGDVIESSFVVSSENLEETYKIHNTIFEREIDRRKGTESKAALLLSSISIATSIVVGASTLLAGNVTISFSVMVSVVLSFIMTIYSARVVWFSIKALQREPYTVLGMQDVNMPGDKDAYYTYLIQKLASIVTSNYKVINCKVDYLTMAQEYYKRVICVIGIYSFFILIFCICNIKKTKISASETKVILNQFENRINDSSNKSNRNFNTASDFKNAPLKNTTLNE